jgi:sec-independent protein translocase protein TatA
MDLGPAELAIILVIVLLLFGGRKIPELARSLGAAKRELEQGLREGHRSNDVDAPEDPGPPANPAGPIS